MCQPVRVPSSIPHAVPRLAAAVHSAGSPMSLSAYERRALDSISENLTGSDPVLAQLLDTFTELTASEVMPAREQIASRWRHRMRTLQRAGRIGSRNPPLRPGRFRCQAAVAVLVLIPLIALLVAMAVALGSGNHAPCGATPLMTCTNPVPTAGSHVGRS